ncbi:MAG: MarR family transcriptional regulator [Gammaproteobacteria bacterium]|nr:MarR family transcriptional regulator [Gammaproteobacteria bacterium]MDH4253583.1 MarR family transcriptional regulator [Gammaproteobacteria bacterium]MDH5310168.1 MarR family transcriptional regulator [Gammaproteobacteria bacterium]
MQEFSRSLPMLLYRAVDAVMPRFRRIFSDFGLTEQQWRVLRVLWEQDEIALGALAELTLIPAPSLVGIVRRLQSQDFVTRRRSDDDRRIVYVLLTPAGRALQARVQPRVDQAYAELRDSIDAGEWNRLLDSLDELARETLETSRPSQDK